MAGAEIPLPDQFASSLYETPLLDNTPQQDVFPDFDSTLFVKAVDIDATQNPGEDVSVKLFDAASITLGTTDAHLVLKGKAGRITPYVFPGPGIDFPSGPAVSLACVKEAGAQEGTTSPSGVVAVKVLASGT